MSQVLKVHVETERDGIVTVEAFSEEAVAGASPGVSGKVLADANKPAGFFVRRRYHGDRFKINDWKEFSPKWMRFVDTPPEGWIEQINAREGQRQSSLEAATVEQNKTPLQRIAEAVREPSEVVSLAEYGKPADAGTINQATGRVTRKKPGSLPPSAA